MVAVPIGPVATLIARLEVRLADPVFNARWVRSAGGTLLVDAPRLASAVMASVPPLTAIVCPPPKVLPALFRVSVPVPFLVRVPPPVTGPRTIELDLSAREDSAAPFPRMYPPAPPMEPMV